MIELVEKAFAQELLSVSSKASKFVDFAWTVYKIGGAVPVSVLGEQFKEAEEKVTALSKAGILRYAMGGFINRNHKKLSLSVTISEDLARQLPRDVKRKEFENIIFRNHGDKIIQSSRTGLTEPLAVMLTSILFYATPERPAFANTIVRRASKISLKTHMECQNILEYYLHRFLGLVSFETGSLLNLSVRSKQRIRMYPKLWELYARPYQERPKEEVTQRPITAFRQTASAQTTKASEQEKRLKGYFPWMNV
ncbi:MAG: hypothetical protein J7K54_05340 [Candidatus Aenigmarchaeota archaeon]|nr:hypothetical protein [Candidatus Aenigmarchaeota archaeon]